MTLFMREIVRATADHFKVPAEEIMGPSRRDHCTWPRHISMVLCRKFCGRSVKEIGTFFTRDHTTVVHASKNVAGWLLKDAKAAQLLDEIAASAHKLSAERQRQDKQWAEDLAAGHVVVVVPPPPPAEELPTSRVRWITVPNRSPIRGPRRPIALPSEFAPPSKARLMGARA